MSHNKKILHHLEEIGPITQLEVAKKYGCLRLAARIGDLRRAGHRIVTEQMTGVNRDGNPVRYALYRLEE